MQHPPVLAPQLLQCGLTHEALTLRNRAHDDLLHRFGHLQICVGAFTVCGNEIQAPRPQAAGRVCKTQKSEPLVCPPFVWLCPSACAHQRSGTALQKVKKLKAQGRARVLTFCVALSFSLPRTSAAAASMRSRTMESTSRPWNPTSVNLVASTCALWCAVVGYSGRQWAGVFDSCMELAWLNLVADTCALGAAVFVPVPGERGVPQGCSWAQRCGGIFTCRKT